MVDQLKYFTKKVIKTLLALSFKKSWSKKVFYLKYDWPGEVKEDADGVFFEKISLYIRRNSFEFILEQYAIVKRLHENLKAKFYFHNEQFFIEFDNLIFNPTTGEEIFILEEVFVHGSYNFKVQYPLVVVDVGMNVGTASLFFASKEEVLRVYSFEPFAATFKQALKNINNNINLRSKIESHNFGLSDKDHKLEVAYNYENKGQVGIYGTSLIRSKINHEDLVLIELKKASREIQRILDDNSGQNFLLKLDCEGAEYSIIDDLATNDLLKSFKIVFIEWHENGPRDLLKSLSNHGFTTFYNQSIAKKIGMIYAVR